MQGINHFLKYINMIPVDCRIAVSNVDIRLDKRHRIARDALSMQNGLDSCFRQDRIRRT